ncbi:uncharacterized protein LOC135211866 [Macrobrachium nipponense]|uniref:uncharacterized protein LOC135211866 n=1 Tax=Macrobrachium nipponense TaxID=159736 RepID=UPI0030C7C4FF
MKDRPYTRRGILSVVASVYGPLGLVTLFILPAKLQLQDMCREQLNWDDNIGEAEVVKWKSWCDQLSLLETMKVDHSYVPDYFGPVQTFQLHHFADASQLGYSTASYL